METTPSIVLVLVVAVVVISAVVFMFLPLGTGYKVTINGEATDASISFTNWDQGSKDLYLFSTQGQPGLWFLDSDELMVEIDIDGQIVTKQIGKFSFGGQPISFSVELRHIEPGSHYVAINLYKITGWFSTFGFGDRSLIDTTTTTINLIE